MHTQPAQGTWINRFAIRFCTIILGVLLFWLLGFLMQDIQSIQGPQYNKIEKKHLDQKLVDQKKLLEKQMAELSRQIETQKQTQTLIGDGSRNLQQTINQLLDLQKLSIQKNIVFSEQSNFTNSLSLFLENQKKYQKLNQTISTLLEKEHRLENQKRQIEAQIKKQRQPARREYNRLHKKHRLKLAFFQLLILIPLLMTATFLIIKKRGIYFPFFGSFGGATLVKVTLVIHEYFPTRYFKYILTTALILVVGRFMIYLIRTIAFPKVQWLVKQYREAYERFLCPVCEYPIRIGPHRLLFWTRRTVNKIKIPDRENITEELYNCPACGTALYEKCPSCSKIRHALLPFCRHCGTEKQINN